MLIRTTSAIDDGAFFLTLGDSCLYLFRGAAGAYLIDTGSSVHIPQLLKRLDELEVKPAEISHIFLSNNNPARIAGLPLLLRSAPDASIYCSQSLQALLKQEEALQMLFEANKSFRDFYPRLRFDGISNEDFVAAFARARPFPSAESITVRDDLTIRAIATPGHSPHSTAFYVPELNLLIADQTFGYFRGKEPLAPGADFSIDQSLESHKLVQDLQVNSLGFHYVGMISGALAQRHLSDLADATSSLVKECKNASIAGVRHEEIVDSLRETVYTSAYQDPLLQWQLDRSVAAIWQQIALQL